MVKFHFDPTFKFCPSPGSLLNKPTNKMKTYSIWKKGRFKNKPEHICEITTDDEKILDAWKGNNDYTIIEIGKKDIIQPKSKKMLTSKRIRHSKNKRE